MADGNLGKISYEVEAKTAALVEGGRKALASLLGLVKGMGQTDAAAKKTDFQLTKTAAAVKGLGAASATTSSALKGLLPLVGFTGFLALAKTIVTTADSYNEMTERVKMATRAGEDYEKVNQRLLDTANRTYRPLSEAAEVYITASKGLEALGKSTSEILDITDSLSFAFVKNATSSERANSAINAFTGAVANGKVNAQQWASILAATPSIVTDVANATGKTEGEILKLGASGKMTADILVNSLQKSMESNRDAADNMKTTVGDATQALVNNLGVLIGKINQTSGVTNSMADAIARVAEAVENADVAALTQELEALKGMVLLVMDGVDYLIEQFEKHVPSAADKVGKSMTEMSLTTAKEVDGIAGAFQGAWAGIQKGAEVLTNNIQNYFSNAWIKVKAEAASFVNSLGDILNVPLQAIGMEGFGKVSFGEEQLKPIKGLADEVQKAWEDAAVGLGAYDKMLTRITDNAIDQTIIEWQKEYGEQVEVAATKTTKLDDATKKTKKTLSEAEKAAKQNAEAIKKLEEALSLAGMRGEELAKAQAALTLNEYATPEQIQKVEELAAKIYQVNELMKLQDKVGDDPLKYIKGSTDPLSGGEFDQQDARYEAEIEKENERYADKLVRLREALESEKIVQDQYNSEFEAMQAEHSKRMQQIDDARTSLMLSSTRGSLDQMTASLGSAFGEQSGIYKAAFAASKAFAIAESIVKIQQGIAAASALPFPANIPAMASVAAATAGIISSIQSVTMGGGRFYGGGVNPDAMYQINEGGYPEILNTADGKQYLMPNTRGEVVSNKDATGGGSAIPKVTVNLIEDSSKAGQVNTDYNDDGTIISVVVANIMGDGAVTDAVSQKFGLQGQGQ